MRSRLLHLSARPAPLGDFGLLHVASVEDIDSCIDRLQLAIRELAFVPDDEERVDRLLGYLLVASIRARQLS